jgi:DNA-binding transcriptional regulator YiaG
MSMTPENLRAAITALGMSQRGLADALFMDERQVRRWFAGATVPEDAAAWIALAVRDLPPLYAAIDDWHQKNPPPKKNNG